MEGVGTPELIVQSGASPHEYSLRPSEATALQDADLVFWIGPDLTPWLADAIQTLSADASVTTLLASDGTVALPFRKGALFEAHTHADAEHEDHADGADQGDKDDHAGHDHAEDEHEGHGHAAYDPHAWLSPRNAAIWLNLIAGQLSAVDPANAGAYFANAAEGVAELDTLNADVNALLGPVRGSRFIVFHDAFQYFEDAFDLPASGAISVSDASRPSPARIAEIRARIAQEGIDCVLAEPQFNPGLVATVLDGTQAGTGVLDPLGADLDPGSALYPLLIRTLAATLASCL
jgi:zinc transport system substrate-binding protein